MTDQSNGASEPAQADELDEILGNLTFEVIRWNYGAVSAETRGEQAKAKASIQSHILGVLEAVERDVIGRKTHTGKEYLSLVNYGKQEAINKKIATQRTALEKIKARYRSYNKDSVITEQPEKGKS